MPSKKNKYTFVSNAVNVNSTMDAGLKPMPPDRWEGAFSVRSATITIRSYLKSRDHALVEMMKLLHQYIQEPVMLSLKSLTRL